MPPLALADVFFRRDPGGLPFQSLDPEASAGSVLVIHDHNRLAIRPNVSAPGFAPVPAECVAAGIAAARKQTVPACVRARARNLTTRAHKTTHGLRNTARAHCADPHPPYSAHSRWVTLGRWRCEVRFQSTPCVVVPRTSRVVTG